MSLCDLNLLSGYISVVKQALLRREKRHSGGGLIQIACMPWCPLQRFGRSIYAKRASLTNELLTACILPCMHELEVAMHVAHAGGSKRL